jgi:hypothetical protein
VRRSIKYALRAFLALVMIPFALLSLYWGWLEFETANFYRSRPILHSMKSVHDGTWTNDSYAARSVLLDRFPIGTELNAALTALKSEDFGCSKQTAPSAAPVDCQLLAPAVLGFTRWIVGLQFNESGRLTDAKVAAWNIFL